MKNLVMAGCAVVALSAPALAGDVDDVMATPSRVTPGETMARDSAATDYLTTVHGEVTAMIGSGGAYGLSGTAILPLGENAAAEITISKSKGPWGLSPYSLAPVPEGEFAPQPYPYGFDRAPLR